MEEHTFLLIDAHALIYRAYYAFPELSTRDGRLVNAVYGFTKAVLTAIRDYEPEYIAVAFDHPKPTNRQKAFAEYKAHREKMPDDLIPQIDIIKQVVEVLNFPQFTKPGFEADDIIGTLVNQLGKKRETSRKQETKELKAVIVTGDKDTFQLVNDWVHVWLPGRGKNQQAQEYDEAAVVSKLGVRPDQVIDLKALMGDSSDNIPGVAGIGAKTAAKLTQTFGTLDQVYQTVEKIQSKKTGEKLAAETVIKGSVLKKLVAGKEQAYMSQDLATILQDVPLKLDLSACKVSGYNKHQALELFEELSFKSLEELLPIDDFELDIHQALL